MNIDYLRQLHPDLLLLRPDYSIEFISELLYRDNAQLKGKNLVECMDMLDAFDGVEFFKRVEKVISNTEKTSYYETASNQVTYERIIIPLYENNQLQFIASYHVDISNHLIWKENLKRSESRFKTILEKVPVAIIVVYGSEIHYVNSTFEMMYGFDKDELVGENITLVQAPEVVEELRERGRRRETGQHTINSYQSLGRKKDGSIFPIHINADRMDFIGGMATIAFIQDLTDIKNLEQEHRILVEEVMRTEKHSSLGLLAGGLAHDFNNILTSVMGFASLLKRVHQDHPKTVAMIDQVEKAVRKATTRTNELRMYTGNLKSTLGAVDLTSIIEGVQSQTYPGLENDVTLEFKSIENNLDVFADPALIRRVIRALVTNSMEANASRIRIEHGKLDLADIPDERYSYFETFFPGSYAYIRIEDDGEGIVTDNISQIFDPFYSRRGKGRGLGLATAHGIIKAHEGGITVQSVRGSGTVFVVYLKLISEKEQEMMEIITGERTRKRTNKVILCDDKESVRSVGKSLLEHLDFEVLDAHDGKHCIEIFKQHPDVWLILMDVDMPVMDGMESHNRIRTFDPDVNIIFMSGHLESDIRNKYLGRLPMQFIQKPFSLEELQQVIDNLT